MAKDDIKCYIKHCKKEMDNAENNINREITLKNNKLYSVEVTFMRYNKIIFCRIIT